MLVDTLLVAVVICLRVLTSSTLARSVQYNATAVCVTGRWVQALLKGHVHLLKGRVHNHEIIVS